METLIPMLTIYELGIQGVFTKALDTALLEGQIDVAVHSLKDVPTQLAKGLSISAILDRNNSADALRLQKYTAPERRPLLRGYKQPQEKSTMAQKITLNTL